MEQNITITDVAKLAGVSRATAGRVVGGYGNVSEKSREKVMQAVEALNYRPNLVAQGLRGQSTKTIAVILGSIKNNYCNKLIYAVEKEAQKQGYNVIVCNTHENVAQEIGHLQNMYGRQVDGVILMSTVKREEEIREQYRELYQGSVPVVFVDRRIRGLDSRVIQSNNAEASYQAARYLLELGHRKIGVLATDDYSTVNERIKGYKRALEEYGAEYREDLVMFAAHNDKEKIREKTAELLNGEGPTALYVLNNSLCIGVLMELKKRQMHIPKDISLLVWDDEELNELLDITTVVQPIEAIGKAAVQELIAQKEKAPGEQGEKREVLEASIVFRKSCRKAD
ncbi:LacI family transcriptional regulator [Muricomes sp. OA1]|uniref:LacI family transcriptional regulator n=1 Tax=Hungatella hathewayi TaxID=154046 RepID=A0A3E2WS11_9FIRM|nr:MULTISPECIES: LacI family DNA-binding transcriptional regulator [Clostridia]MEE0199514.1 LacI family DNA-binding transcriptional regulator [Muricomes sp.]MCH1972785.1 LacI family transcriptional regulator [Muricomes sp. OA1]MRM90118.1 LacI family transcriptional regulator [Faecalicatena contorta]RGC29484.1 LacI family transcriptional regulator [Hungatella hathewayi]GKH31552.1 LacI family transcriptional regulator [Faecalicatena contorta]